MDLNYPYHRQQVSLFMAEHAASELAGRAHLELADGYSSRDRSGEKAGSICRGSVMERLTRGEAAAELREQAASCRRLARRARTNGGSCALATLADRFDDDARRIDPSSERRWAREDMR